MKIGDKIDALHTLKDQKREMEKALKEFEEEIGRLEADVLQTLEEEGLAGGAGKEVTATIVESVKPNVEEWDEFYKYISENDYWHLLDRRPSVLGCRELFEMGQRIPGVVPFVKKSIRLTKRGK